MFIFAYIFLAREYLSSISYKLCIYVSHFVLLAMYVMPLGCLSNHVSFAEVSRKKNKLFVCINMKHY